MLTQDKDFVFVDAEKEFDLAFSALKTGRSLAASYSLQADIQCKYQKLY
jgi:valyl-tRNA synthetase